MQRFKSSLSYKWRAYLNKSKTKQTTTINWPSLIEFRDLSTAYFLRYGGHRSTPCTVPFNPARSHSTGSDTQSALSECLFPSSFSKMEEPLGFNAAPGSYTHLTLPTNSRG